MSDDITSVTLGNVNRSEDNTDRERLEALPDEDIHRAVEDDPDASVLNNEWGESATFMDLSAEKKRISTRLDKDIRDLVRTGGSGYRSRINKVFRECMTVKRYKNVERTGVALPIPLPALTEVAVIRINRGTPIQKGRLLAEAPLS